MCIRDRSEKVVFAETVLKVAQGYINSVYNFLLVFRRIWYHFRDSRILVENHSFSYAPVHPVGISPRRMVQENKTVAANSSRLAVSTQYVNVTDRKTDIQNGHNSSIYRACTQCVVLYKLHV